MLGGQLALSPWPGLHSGARSWVDCAMAVAGVRVLQGGLQQSHIFIPQVSGTTNLIHRLPAFKFILAALWGLVRSIVVGRLLHRYALAEEKC